VLTAITRLFDLLEKNYMRNHLITAQFEVLTAAQRRFGATHCLHFHGLKIIEASSAVALVSDLFLL
jgi:hypothetical protein